jgi:hypothetical protein
MTYVRPQIVGVFDALSVIQLSENKGGPSTDGDDATSPAYEADE